MNNPYSTSDYISSDLFDLNSSSVQFAKFYCCIFVMFNMIVNHQEIHEIRYIFDVMKEYVIVNLFFL